MSQKVIPKTVNSPGESALTCLNDLSRERYADHRDELIQAFKAVREKTTSLTSSLSAEDMQLQSMPDASPGKWHLAHTSWFFEAFILAKFFPGFRWHNPLYARLFNSYYHAMGEQFPRPERGVISRPGLDEIHEYRQHITDKMQQLLATVDTVELGEIAPLLVLGINHEQQHQELILTDIKHALFQNPSYPVVFDHPAPNEKDVELHWLRVNGGETSIGYEGEGFCFDNELPHHRVLLQDFKVANRLVTNAEWMEFINDGGYEQPLLWLSDGWAWRNTNAIQSPLYWLRDDNGWQYFTLTGLKPIINHEAVSHVSYYEADAYARWAGHRLPTEQEWEHATRCLDSEGSDHNYGHCWEWTSNPYSPYPGFRPASGNVGEYNGKFMINQVVLRGSSIATSAGHSRPSYRNFFYPEARWQFSGLRLVNNE